MCELCMNYFKTAKEKTIKIMDIEILILSYSFF